MSPLSYVACLLCVIIIVLIYFIVNLMKQAEAMEATMEEYDTAMTYYQDALTLIRDKSVEARARMVECDIKGSFEADDEVGYAFQQIKSIVDILNQTIQVITTDEQQQ